MFQSLPQRPTLADIRTLYTEHDATVRQVVEYFILRSRQHDSSIHGIVRYNETLALKLADKLDSLRQTKSIHDILKQYPLFGVPYVMKDNILVEGELATSQSQILDGYRAPYSSDVFSTLTKAGAVLIGQTNMDEFAFGSSTEYSGFGQKTHNPWDLERVPGGTSGGSAACVASGQVPFAIGTDTGGSIRQPSSFCGTVGIRPTYGKLSRFGIMASTSSFDQPGPITNTIQDNELILQILASSTQSDQTCLQYAPKVKNEPGNTTQKLTIGIPEEYFGEGLTPSVRERFDRLIAHLQENYQVQTVSLPTSKYTLSVYYILQTVEASANLERFDGVRYGKQAQLRNQQDLFYAARGNYLGSEAKRRIMLGTYTSSAGYYDAYYNKACQVRELIRRDFEKAFESIDVILMPTSPFPAFKIGENTDDPLAMYLADIMTVSHPIARVPGLVVPIGTVAHEGKQLPVGVQLVSKENGEADLYNLGQVIQSYEFDETKIPQ